jgi:hydrogenase/urease accessory protein HupE
MADLAYILCALTSIVCAVLLLRGYKQSGLRLLFWSGLCFVGLALNNILLIVDIRVLPDVDLSNIRSLPALGGLLLLIFGLIWEKR